MSSLLISTIVIAGVTALDAAFIPATVIVLAGLWVFSTLDRRDPLPD